MNLCIQIDFLNLKGFKLYKLCYFKDRGFFIQSWRATHVWYLLHFGPPSLNSNIH